MSSYSSGQQDDHAKYAALNESSNPLNPDSFAMNDRKVDSQVYSDNPTHPHTRQDSVASMSDIMNQPVREPFDSYSNYSNNPAYQPYYPGRQQPTYTDTVPPPRNAYTTDPGPTPKFTNNMYYGESSNLEKPEIIYNHPGE